MTHTLRISENSITSFKLEISFTGTHRTKETGRPKNTGEELKRQR